MNWRNSYYCLICLFLASCEGTKKGEISTLESEITETKVEVSSKYLIEAEALKSEMENLDVKIIDFRKENNYYENHIEGAIQIWRSDIEDHSYPYAGMMAQKDSIAKLLGDLGINHNDRLVVYDDRGSCDAARFWWVMQNYDFDNVQILNGGLKAWLAAGGPVTDEIEIRSAMRFEFPENSSLRYLVGKEELSTRITNQGPEMLIDTRTTNEYTGKRQKEGATRAGRIPGSRLIDWSEAIDYHGTHKFKSQEALENRYGTLKISKDHPIITYCHTGVRSALTTFVLTQLLGYQNVKNYDGSWTEWSYYENHSIEKDSVTTIYK